MTTLREAAQQALVYILATSEHDQQCDVLDLDEGGRHKPCSCLLQDVLDDLRTALAEQPAEQKPVGTVKSISGPNYENGLTAVFVHTDTNSTLKTGDPLYTAPQSAIPPGYKLVPVEPTEEMIDAAKNNGAEGSRKEISGDYKALLAAAPETHQTAKREPQCHKRANDYCKCSRKAMLCDGVGPLDAAHGITKERHDG